MWKLSNVFGAIENGKHISTTGISPPNLLGRSLGNFHPLHGHSFFGRYDLASIEVVAIAVGEDVNSQAEQA